MTPKTFLYYTIEKLYDWPGATWGSSNSARNINPRSFKSKWFFRYVLDLLQLYPDHVTSSGERYFEPRYAGYRGGMSEYSKHINRVIILILSKLFWSQTEVKIPYGKTTQKVTSTSVSSDKFIPMVSPKWLLFQCSFN